MELCPLIKKKTTKKGIKLDNDRSETLILMNQVETMGEFQKQH
jgi:hypothetical protein